MLDLFQYSLGALIVRWINTSTFEELIYLVEITGCLSLYCKLDLKTTVTNKLIQISLIKTHLINHCGCLGGLFY